MFWANKDKTKILELKKRSLFTAEFLGTNNFNWAGEEKKEQNIKFLTKKVALPSINIPFERLHGNQHVHYYHVGEMNWEPITITFVDVLENDQYNGKDQLVPNLKKMFYDYLIKNNITENNRTGMLDLATFCTEIRLKSYSTYIRQDQYVNDNPNILLDRELGFSADENGSINGDYVKDNRLSVAEDFIIKKPKITKIDFGSLDYSSDDANEVTITFLPEWCEYSETSYGDEQFQKAERKKQATKEA
jgi:hypothetical protein